MSLFRFRELAKGSVLRAVLLAMLGIVAFLFPDFLDRGMIYAVAAYAIFNGAIGIVNSFLRGEQQRIAYLNIGLAVFAVIGGILSIVYFRYLSSIQPVFYGALLAIESIVYFAAVLKVKNKIKPIFIVVTLLVLCGGVALTLYSFGFGGLPGLSKMFGGLLLLSSVGELLIHLMEKADNQY